MIALMPHGTCFLWNPWLTFLHAVGDFLVVLAYFSIPLVVYFNRQLVNPTLRPIVLLFAAFILSCGIGHSIRIWNIWHTNYWLEGIWGWLTGLISLYTAVQLIYLIPQFLSTQQDLTRTRRLLEQDPLTGIANRRGLEQTVQALTNQPRSTNQVEHTLVLMDLDGFKQVNDTYGHHTGDQLLQEVAQRIVKHTRSADLAARIGGDEFAVIMLGASPTEVQAVTHKLCRAIQAIELPDLTPQPEGPLVSASVGIARLDLEAPLEVSYRNADQALYDAKDRGKNQVVVH